MQSQNPILQQWVAKPVYDLETARAMLDSGRYFYVVFCCQQAIEKALKALIIQNTETLPPRIHNLPRLAEAAGVVPEPGELDFIAELSVYYKQSRYPEENEDLTRATTRARAADALASTERITKWLLLMIA